MLAGMEPFTVRELVLVGISFFGGGMIPWLWSRAEWSRQRQEILDLRVKVGVLQGLAETEKRLAEAEKKLADTEKKVWHGTRQEFEALEVTEKGRLYAVVDE